jgi:uncharacterized protein YdbL (DUF1318 family)
MLKEQETKNIHEARKAVSIERLAETYGVSTEIIRTLIDEAVKDRVLEGRYTQDGQQFITDAALRSILRNKLKDERRTEN